MAGLLWYRSYMDSLANTNGYYPDIHAGHADRVTELTLDAPYLIRETPAGYNQLELIELVGGSVAWNQLCYGLYGASTSDGITTSYDSTTHKFSITNNSRTTNYGTGSTRSAVSAKGSNILGHKYIVLANSTKNITGVGIYEASSDGVASNVFYSYNTIFESTMNGYFLLRINKTYDFVTVHPVGDVTEFTMTITDLTQMFGSTIADYVYSLEQATAGSGIAWLKSYGYFTQDYYAYSAPTMQSVEATSHIAKDGNGNVISTTTFGSVTLRGILMKDADGHLYYEGDTYEWDGTVTRYFGERAYQAGDESLTDAITDGTNTVYKLNTPTTESADPFTAVQTVEDGGTEEFVTSNNVPVGNVSVYRRA